MKDIHARVPVDRLAARVVGGGVSFVPNKRVLNNDSEMPIATRPFSRVELKAEGFADLSGRRVGRFTVLGIARDFNRQWVVRCDCGRYSTRTAKAIKNPANSVDRCEHCRHLAFILRDDRMRQARGNG